MTEWVSGWVQELSAPRKNGIALCPFAKKAWDGNEVKVVESQNLWAAVHKEVSEFGSHKVVLCIQPIPEQEYAELEAGCGALNHWFAFDGKDVWLLSSEMHGCSIVFVQKRSELNTASHSLERLGYYTDYAAEEFGRLIEQRRNLSRD
jgi:hypothetical protein